MSAVHAEVSAKCIASQDSDGRMGGFSTHPINATFLMWLTLSTYHMPWIQLQKHTFKDILGCPRGVFLSVVDFTHCWGHHCWVSATASRLVHRKPRHQSSLMAPLDWASGGCWSRSGWRGWGVDPVWVESGHLGWWTLLGIWRSYPQFLVSPVPSSPVVARTRRQNCCRPTKSDVATSGSSAPGRWDLAVAKLRGNHPVDGFRWNPCFGL